jgi:sarcosine oxidase, subunit beta
VPRKLILCRCEDVTAADVEHAVASGYSDLEEVKRYTGFGTGPCQGKECLRQVALAIAAAARVPPAAVRPFTARPPLAPTALKLLATPAHGAMKAPPPPPSPSPSPSQLKAPLSLKAPRSSTGARGAGSGRAAALPASVDVAIIGGGVMGLAIAYHLARGGMKRIAVLEGSYLAWGASGRNGGGLRQQWSTEMNIRLMQESMEICQAFAHDMRITVWMRQGGYLFLARTRQTRDKLRRSIALQNSCQVPTRLISTDEARDLVPELDTSSFVAASYNPTDAVIFPWPFLWGYARAAAELGVGIHTATPVEAIERRGGAFVLRTGRGAVTAERVLCAAGAWSPRVAALAGLALPNRPQRHEIMSTEPLKPFLRPMVSVLESGLYFSQSLRGEIVGGVGLPEVESAAGEAHDPIEVRLGSRLAFLEAMAAGLIDVMPLLGEVKVVRQWAGPYDITSDGNPIVGEAPGLPGFYLCCGFMGHGFMMAPVVAKHYALHLLGKATHPFFHRWRLARFAEGDVEREDMIIG